MFREELTLFVLVRDVKRFDEMFAAEVLELLESLGFTGPFKEPQRIVQEGCLPFDPTSDAPCTKVCTLDEICCRLHMDAS